MATLTVGPSSGLWGEVRPPSDKSITHRAYMLGAIAVEGGKVGLPLRAEDCDCTLQILRDLGASIEDLGDWVRIRPSVLEPSKSPLYCGNSGTTMRLMCGLLAGLGIRAELRGDASLSKRPMGRVVEPLRRMGAEIEGETAPVMIRPAPLRGIDYLSPVASAQVKSAVLLAGLFAEGTTSVTEPYKSRDHTERMLQAGECDLKCDGLSVAVTKGTPNRVDMRVPADISSASFFMVGAAVLGGPLTVKEVGVNPTRTGILDVLVAAGVHIEVVGLRTEQGEPMADLFVEADMPLRAFSIAGDLVPRLIDEIPILAVLATQCEGTSVIKDATELRVKESDRIERMADGLRRMGAQIESFDDGMAISGPTRLKAAKVDAGGDHRVAMAFAIAGLISDGEIRIDGAQGIATSFPGFESELRRLTR